VSHIFSFGLFDIFKYIIPDYEYKHAHYPSEAGGLQRRPSAFPPADKEQIRVSSSF